MQIQNILKCMEKGKISVPVPIHINYWSAANNCIENEDLGVFFKTSICWSASKNWGFVSIFSNLMCKSKCQVHFCI